MLFSCHDVESRLDAYAVGDLDARALLAMQTHLNRCAACQRRTETARGLARLLRIGMVRVPPIGYLEGLPGRITEGMEGRLRARRANRRYRWALMAPVAALLVLAMAPWLSRDGVDVVPGVADPSGIVTSERAGRVEGLTRSPQPSFREPSVRTATAIARDSDTVFAVRLLSSAEVAVRDDVPASPRFRSDGLRSDTLDSPVWQPDSERWMAWARPTIRERTTDSWERELLARGPDRDLPVSSRRQAGRVYERSGLYGLTFAVAGGSVAGVSLPLGP